VPDAVQTSVLQLWHLGNGVFIIHGKRVIQLAYNNRNGLGTG
jgi:hypothetical protein